MTGCSDTITLSELVAEHSDRTHPNIILKIDIEGDEWDLFDRIYDTALRAFKKPHEAFVVFHVHANNFGNLVNIGNVATPQTLEISFANQSCYSFKNTYESFPTSIDRPNESSIADVYLGNFCF